MAHPRPVPVDWEKLAVASIDPMAVRQTLPHLQERMPEWFVQAMLESMTALVAAVAASPAVAETLIREPEWVGAAFDAVSLEHGRRAEGYRREVAAFLDPALAQADHARALRELRRFRQREQIRIAARDLTGRADVSVLTRELSDLADACLGGVLRVVRAQLASKVGEPWELDPEGVWRPTEFCVLGMGKLGGQELNYSSDVDLLLVYSEEGFVFRDPPTARTKPPTSGLANHQFFKRLAEAFIAEVGARSDAGQLYRIDMRLRPEGDAGPLARSLSSYESYYAQWGQTWERLMLIKARPVAGDRSLGNEFLEMVQQFRYPRSVSPHLLDDVAATKRRMETETIAGDLERDVKRGRGGIREIEFVVQSLQLLNGGKQPFLQGATTLPLLERLASYRLLSEDEATRLAAAYRFWRNVEHRLQMERDQQTHTLPANTPGRTRIARLMGFRRLPDFEKAREGHAQFVRATYEKFLPGRGGNVTVPERTALPGSFETEAGPWLDLLRRHAFRDPDQALKLLREFVHGPGWAHVTARTEELARRLVPQFLQHCLPPAAPAGGGPSPARKWLSDPDRVMARLDSFISAYGARASLYELWDSNPLFFELLLWLFDRSEHLAEVAIRTPDLIEELVISGRLRRAKPVDETLRDLRFGVEDADQHQWIRRYHQAEELRVGLRSILDFATLDQTGTELTGLAEACLEYAAEVAVRRGRRRKIPFAIIGLGKLGGAELGFGSDLDIIFVAPTRTRDLPALQRLAASVIDLLSARHELGLAFECDARLRPDGEKGPLVTPLDAAEDYYRRRAQLWELQALTRARFVAGDAATGQRFLELADRVTNFAQGNPGVAAWRSDWRQEIVRMRGRIERERTPAGAEALAFKTSAGGLIDAEFMAQTFGIAGGWREPNAVRGLQRALASGALTESSGQTLLDAYRELRRIESILRRWSFQGEAVLPVDPAPQKRVAIRCGFADAPPFLEAVTDARRRIRSVWDEVMLGASAQR